MITGIMALFDWIIQRLVALASSCLYKPWPDIFFTDKKYKKINPSDNIYCFLLIRNIFHFSSIKAFFPQNCEMKQDIKKQDNNKNTPGNIPRFKKNPQNTGTMGGIEKSTNLYTYT